MKVKTESLEVLMNEVADGNYNKFARILGIDVGYLHKVMHSKTGAGALFFSKLIEYCNKNNLDYNQYIVFY